jgi:hypothetical protein
MYATKHLDWLSITVNSLREVEAILPIADWHYVGKGRHGYRAAYEDRLSGARVETDSAAAGMDTHLTLSGMALYAVRTTYRDGDDGLVNACRTVNGRASRIDLAINAHEGKLTVQDFRRAIKSGEAKSPMRRSYYVEGSTDGVDGSTLYLGSPKSDRQLRVYDKAAEQGIVDGKAWLRLELALRDLRAKAALLACGDNGTADTISAHVADVLVWDKREYSDLVVSVGHAIAPIARKETNTQRWLRDQCAPALAKVVAVEPDFMVQFMASFQASLDKLNSGE